MARRRVVLRGVVAALVSVQLSGCWLQPDYDGGHTRWNPSEQKLTAANVASLTPRWSVDFPARFQPDPLISGGKVLVGRQDSTATGVLALDAATGATLWDRDASSPTATDTFTNHPATIVDGEVWSDWYGAVGNECVFGLTRLDRDGNVLGTDRSGYTATTPVQSGDHIVEVHTTVCPFPGLPPATLSVRDADTRQVLWTAGSLNFGNVTVSQGLVITDAGAFPLAGCGAPTCSPIWQLDLSSGFHPVVVGPGGQVFVVKPGFGGPNGEVRAYSRTDGTQAWRLAFNAVSAEIAVDDEHLYVAASNNGFGAGYLQVYDIDGCGAATCQPLWSARAADGAWAPTVAGDVVYVAGNDNRVHAFRADGCGFFICGEIGSVGVDGLGIGSIAVAEGRLVVSSMVTFDARFKLTAFAPAGIP